MPTATTARENPAPVPSADALVRQAIRKVTIIATLPEVTAKIVQIVEDPRSNAQTLKKIIANDPALATRILKLVNSAFYGVAGHVTTVDRAIVMLGFGEVKNLAVAANISALFHKADLGGPFTAKDLWRHCVAVAVAAREMSRSTKTLSKLTSESFLSGLIHDLGLLVQLQANVEGLSKVCQAAHRQLNQGTTPVNFCALERELIGVDHEQLGQAMAEHWRFPELYQQVIGCHHHPKMTRSDSRDMAILVHMADTLVCRNFDGFNLTARSQQLDATEMQNFGLDQEKIDRLITTIPALVDEALPIFG